MTPKRGREVLAGESKVTHPLDDPDPNAAYNWAMRNRMSMQQVESRLQRALNQEAGTDIDALWQLLSDIRRSNKA